MIRLTAFGARCNQLRCEIRDSGASRASSGAVPTEGSDPNDPSGVLYEARCEHTVGD